MGARDKYEKQQQKNRGKQPAKAGPICPRYKAKKGAKVCRHFNKGGTCKLAQAFLCIEWMRGKGYDDGRIRDACAELTRIPVDMRESRVASDAEQGRVIALVHATEEHIQELEAIDFAATLDVPHMGGVRIVNKYRSDGTRQLSIRHALCLAAVTAAFPGATVSELVIAPQPNEQKKRKGKR